MTDRERLCAENLAIGSSCCGFLGEVTLTDSAVILLFAGMLGAGDMLSLVTTSVLPLFNGLLIIPMAWFVTKLGRKKLILTSCALASAAYFIAASSPWFGNARVGVLIGSVIFFAFSLTGFISGWFPMLGTFLTEERRTVFFGRMRFCHQMTATVFIVLVSFLIGEKPSCGTLQAVLFLSGIIFTGRGLCISRIPEYPEPRKEDPDWFAGLKTAWNNRPLVHFSIYQIVLNLAVYGTVPLTMLYLKNEIHAPDNAIVLLSGAALAGMLPGYLFIGKITRFLGTRRTFLLLQILFFPANIGMAFLQGDGFFFYLGVAMLLMTAGFGIAAFSILASTEMMALAKPGNKTMAMAFCGAFFYGGAGLSRFIASLILGSALLADGLNFFCGAFCRYQLMFLWYFILTVAAALLLLRGWRKSE